MKMNLVNKIRVSGYNVKRNAGKYMVVLGLGAMIVLANSCASSPQEITYTPEQADEIAEKAVIAYQENQKVEADKTQVETNTTDIVNLKTDVKGLEKTVTEGFAKIPGQLDDVLKKYSEEQESEDVYVLSHTGRQHDVSHTGRSTPYKAGSVGEVEAAVRYYSTIGALKNMDHKSGFKNIFGSVPYEWVDGISSWSNRELEYNNAFYINEKQGIAIFYFRDGGKSTRKISAGRAEDFIVNHLWNKPSDINKFTIVEAGPHYK